MTWDPDPKAGREKGGGGKVTMGCILRKLRDPAITAIASPAKPIKYLSLPPWLVILLIKRLLVLCHFMHFCLLSMHTPTHTGTMNLERAIHLIFALDLSCLQPVAWAADTILSHYHRFQDQLPLPQCGAFSPGMLWARASKVRHL